MANEYISVMPHLVDLGVNSSGKNIYINMNSISHIYDDVQSKVMQVFMYTTPVDREGQLQPLTLTGATRENLLNFVEDMDIESTL